MSSDPTSRDIGINDVVDVQTSLVVSKAIRMRELRENRFSAITEVIRVVAIKGQPLKDVVHQAVAMARERNAGIEFEVNGVTLQVFRWSEARQVLDEFDKQVKKKKLMVGTDKIP